jgi:hypothetical protein
MAQLALQYSALNHCATREALLYILNSNKTGPTGPSFVAPGGTSENYNRLRTGQQDVHRALTWVICMSIFPDSKWRRDWLHYLYLWEVLTCWKHWAVCLNDWHTAQTPIHTPQDMPPEVSSQSPSPEQTMGGVQYYIETWLHGTLFHIR